MIIIENNGWWIISNVLGRILSEYLIPYFSFISIKSILHRNLLPQNHVSLNKLIKMGTYTTFKCKIKLKKDTNKKTIKETLILNEFENDETLEEFNERVKERLDEIINPD